jgi:hypothetical protein
LIDALTPPKGETLSVEIVRALAIVGAHASADRAKKAAAPLIRALDDIRLRAFAATALGALDDDDAIEPLRAKLVTERHVDARGPEAIALLWLGDVEHALPLVQWMLGVPDLPPDATEILAAICAMAPRPPSWIACGGDRATLTLPTTSMPGAARLIVSATRDATTVTLTSADGTTTTVDARASTNTLEFKAPIASRARLEATATTAKTTLPPLAWIPRVDDLPPPKPDRALNDPPPARP